ncbi:MAG: ATP-dependent helicase [Bradymonadia bacterium]
MERLTVLQTNERALEGLNAVQREAVLHGEGPLLLLAGAGSGKTRVVTTRIARLLAEGEHPDSIMALTFTNRAAAEMRERVGTLLGLVEQPPLLISTFHALGAKLLRQHGQIFGRTRYFSIYDEDDQVSILRGVTESMGLTLKRGEHKSMLRAFARAKNDALEIADTLPPSDFVGLDWARIGEEYERRLRRADAFDFGDLILRSGDLFEKDPRLASMYRRLWKWVLVDEFQDTNVAQYRWLKSMAPVDSNLFVVGDDDQSIYGWRGAEVQNILDFPEQYPGARVVRLEQNYRSQRHILDAANRVIEHNQKRLGKSLWTEREGQALVELEVANSGRAEANYVAAQIAELCQQGDLQPADIAVLMRANHLSFDLETCLRALSVPYRVVRGRAFFERAEVRDALAYVRLLVNSDDDVAFKRAIASPARGVGKVSLKKLDAYVDEQSDGLWGGLEQAIEQQALKGKAKTGLGEFVGLLNRHRGSELKGLAASDAVRTVLLESGLLKVLDREERDEDVIQRQENIERLLTDIRAWGTQSPEGELGEYLEQVKLVSDGDSAATDAGEVSLMSIHAAKGLEFPVVFVIGMEEGIFPNHRAIAADGLEEERRLCYVAITRAKDRLVLTRARRRQTFQETQYNAASRFLSELPPEVLNTRERVQYGADVRAARRRSSTARHDTEHQAHRGVDSPFQRGVRVWHAQFGAGTVLELTHGVRLVLKVEFEGMEPMKVVSDFVSLYDG